MIQNRLTKIDGLCLLNVLPVPVARRWQVVGVDSIYRPPPSNNDHILFITRRSKLSPPGSQLRYYQTAKLPAVR